MNDKRTKPSSTRTDWERLDRLTDEEVEAAARSDPDNPPLTREQLAAMEVVWPEPKALISLRLDRAVIGWFKDQGPGYQTRINAVLSAYVRAASQSARKPKPHPKPMKRTRRQVR